MKKVSNPVATSPTEGLPKRALRISGTVTALAMRETWFRRFASKPVVTKGTTM